MSDKYINKISTLMFKHKTEEEAKQMDFIDIVCNIANGGEYKMQKQSIPYSRSNFFKVSDIDKAKEIAKKTNSKVVEKDGKISLIYMRENARREDECVDFYYSEKLEGYLTIHGDIQDILLEGEKAIFIEYSCSDIATFITDATMVTTEAIKSCTNIRVDLMEMVIREFDKEQLYGQSK